MLLMAVFSVSEVFKILLQMPLLVLDQHQSGLAIRRPLQQQYYCCAVGAAALAVDTTQSSIHP